jgi:hypothetical protein
VNITGSVFLGILGVVADSLNHLVFTMPFLPSEGQPAKALINEELREVLVFRYLPILWYRYPIPNEIREYWYNQRPDILKYMQKAYQNLDIQFLPDGVVEESNRTQWKEGITQLTEQTFLPTKEHFSTQILADTNFEQVGELQKSISFFTETIHDSFLQSFEKLG